MNCHNHNEKKDVNNNINSHAKCDHNDNNHENDYLEQTHAEHVHKHSGHHHLWMMVLCILPMFIFMIYKMIKINSEEPVSWWLYLSMLLCPLSHVLMMGGHNNNNEDRKSIKKEVEKNEIK